MHIKRLTQWDLKVNASGVKEYLSGQSLHLFGATIVIISHLLGAHKNDTTPSLVH